MLSEILAHVDRSELVALTQAVVRIPSVCTPGDPTITEAAAAAFVQRWFEAEGFPTEVQEVAPGRPNAIHQVNELVDIDELVYAARIYMTASVNYLEIV